MLAHAGTFATPFIRVFRNGKEIAARALDKDLVTLGKHSSCDVVLDAEGIARLHALIERSPFGRGYRVSNLCWIGAVYLNGEKISRAGLQLGDTLTIGEFEVRVTPEGPAPRPIIDDLCLPELDAEEIDESDVIEAAELTEISSKIEPLHIVMGQKTV
jgi:pSer/pThr/pTyr-binding forkhead associated (FHA) protein